MVENVFLCRKEAIVLAEKERHKKYRKQDEEREVVRQSIRDKVESMMVVLFILFMLFSTILKNL